VTQPLAAFLRGERAAHVAAIARIDARLAGLSHLPLPERTPAAVVAVLRTARRPMRRAEIGEALADQGRRVGEDALYQCLCRLARAGAEVRRVEAGLYAWAGQPEGEE
jgi:hypothetical protein